MDLLGRTPIGKTIEVIYLVMGFLIRLSSPPFPAMNTIVSIANTAGALRGEVSFGFESSRMTSISTPGNENIWLCESIGLDLNEPADLFGSRPVTSLLDFDNVPIRTPDEFLMRVRRTIPYTTVNIALLREGKKIVVPVKIGKLTSRSIITHLVFHLPPESSRSSSLSSASKVSNNA